MNHPFINHPLKGFHQLKNFLREDGFEYDIVQYWLGNCVQFQIAKKTYETKWTIEIWKNRYVIKKRKSRVYTLCGLTRFTFNTIQEFKDAIFVEVL